MTSSMNPVTGQAATEENMLPPMSIKRPMTTLMLAAQG